jgi:hypothetical protein
MIPEDFLSMKPSLKSSIFEHYINRINKILHTANDNENSGSSTYHQLILCRTNPYYILSKLPPIPLAIPLRVVIADAAAAQVYETAFCLFKQLIRRHPIYDGNDLIMLSAYGACFGIFFIRPAHPDIRDSWFRHITAYYRQT